MSKEEPENSRIKTIKEKLRETGIVDLASRILESFKQVCPTYQEEDFPMKFSDDFLADEYGLKRDDYLSDPELAITVQAVREKVWSDYHRNLRERKHQQIVLESARAQGHTQKLEQFYEELNDAYADYMIVKSGILCDFKMGKAYNVKWDNLARVYEIYSKEEYEKYAQRTGFSPRMIEPEALFEGVNSRFDNYPAWRAFAWLASKGYEISMNFHNYDIYHGNLIVRISDQWFAFGECYNPGRGHSRYKSGEWSEEEELKEVDDEDGYSRYDIDLWPEEEEDEEVDDEEFLESKDLSESPIIDSPITNYDQMCGVEIWPLYFVLLMSRVQIKPRYVIPIAPSDVEIQREQTEKKKWKEAKIGEGN